MPTPTDLHDAFAVLERQADSHELQLDFARPTPSRPSRKRLPAMLLAAATVAALAVGGALWSGSRHGTPTPADGAHPLPVRALPFLLPADSGWHVRDPAAHPDETSADLVGPAGHLQLELWAPGARQIQPQRGLARVDIAGRKGWYVDGTGPGIVYGWTPGRGNPSSPEPGRAVETDQLVLWHFAPDAWAILRTGKHGPDLARLLAAARALDFTGHTPIRVPFKLAQAPGDEPLHSLAVQRRRGHWQVEATWGTNWPDTEIVVAPADRPISAIRGRHFTVAGHPAVWWRGLDVDLGGGTQLAIVGPSDDQHPRSLTRRAATAIAESLTLAPDLSDRGTWFPATTALP
jgi:hypothetical protein